MNYLNFSNKEDLTNWYKKNCHTEKSVYIFVEKGNPSNCHNELSYIDAVEVALCFGWIDSTLLIIDGKCVNKFTPRLANSNWTELNKERCRRLIKLNLMTEDGLAVCPNLNETFVPNQNILKIIKTNKKAFSFFCETPALYQKIRLSNLEFYYKKDKNQFDKALNNFIKNCELNKLYGEWNDYGRLLDY